MSRINSVIKNNAENMDAYNFSRALAETRDLFWLEFCDMYIEEIKERIYAGAKEEKETAQAVLLEVFVNILKLFAPFMPHICEECYQSLNAIKNRGKSITIEAYPNPNIALINEFYEKLGEYKTAAISTIRKYKNSKGMALNKEISKAAIYLNEEKALEYLEKVRETIGKTCKILSLDVKTGKAPDNAIEINKDMKLVIEP